MLRIGSKKAGIQYKKMICAYAIIEWIKDKKIATDKSDIYFLLGGGREEDELIEETLKREIIEKTGYSLRDVELFDKINYWRYNDKYGYLDVEATIYIAKLDKKILEPIENDHRILWVSPLEYKDKLYHKYQKYILNKYILKRRKYNERWYYIFTDNKNCGWKK